MAAVNSQDGHFDVQVSATCNTNSEGQQVGIVLSFQDISDRIRADDAEREAEKRQVMLESFGAACHHLFRAFDYQTAQEAFAGG